MEVLLAVVSGANYINVNSTYQDKKKQNNNNFLQKKCYIAIPNKYEFYKKI